MLLRLNPVVTRSFFAEPEKQPDLITKLSQLSVGGSGNGGRVWLNRTTHIYIVSRYKYFTLTFLCRNVVLAQNDKCKAKKWRT